MTVILFVLPFLGVYSEHVRLISTRLVQSRQTYSLSYRKKIWTSLLWGLIFGPLLTSFSVTSLKFTVINLHHFLLCITILRLLQADLPISNNTQYQKRRSWTWILRSCITSDGIWGYSNINPDLLRKRSDSIINPNPLIKKWFESRFKFKSTGFES